jgi:hypothetical protein
VKIGDVNTTALPNLASVEDRNVQGTFGFDLEERTVKAGEEVKVAFRGKDMERIMGYQLTLGFDRTALSFEDIEYGVAKEGNFGLALCERRHDHDELARVECQQPREI